MKHVLAAALFVCPLLSQTVQTEAAGPIDELTINTTSLGLTTSNENSLLVDCNSGTGFSGGHVTGELTPITQRVPFLVNRTLTSVTARFSRLRTNVACVAALAGAPGSGSGSGTASWTSPSLNFGTLIDFSCGDLSFTATGLTVGTPLLVVPYSGIGLVSVSAWATATDTARVRVCNSSGGDVAVSGVFIVKQVASGYLSGSGTLDFDLIAGGSQSLTMTISGATTSMGLVLVPPAAFSAGIQLIGRVTASNTLTITATNLSDADINPASASFTGVLIQ